MIFKTQSPSRVIEPKDSSRCVDVRTRCLSNFESFQGNTCFWLFFCSVNPCDGNQCCGGWVRNLQHFVTFVFFLWCSISFLRVFSISIDLRSVAEVLTTRCFTVLEPESVAQWSSAVSQVLCRVSSEDLSARQLCNIVACFPPFSVLS